jgi:hypothetical protein
LNLLKEGESRVHREPTVYDRCRCLVRISWPAAGACGRS